MNPARILLVEDEAIVAMDIRHRLESMGYQVAGCVAAGSQAIAAIEQLRPDLILMDIILHGEIDGVQVAETVRRQFAIPVVYLTACLDGDTLLRVKETDPFGFVLKPFNDPELYAAIELALYKSRAGRALRENEEWLAITLRSMNDGVVATDPEGRIKLMNVVAETLTGFAASEAQGREIHEIVRVSDAIGRPVRFDLGAAPSAQIQAPSRTALTLLSRTGQVIPVDTIVSPMHDARGLVIGMVLVVRDRTEPARAQAVLAEERNLLRSLIDAFPDSIYVKDASGHFVIGNQALAMRMGVKHVDELIGKTDFDFFPKEYAERFLADEQRVLATKQPLINQEDRLLDVTSDVRWLLTTKAPLCNRAGEVIGLMGIGRDITQRKQKQAEQKRLESGMLEMQKQESIGVLAAGLAHDFNNMLMCIQGNLELAMLNLQSPLTVGGYLKDINRACQRAVGLIQQMLAYAGKAQYRMEPLNLSVLIREIVQLIRPLLSQQAALQLQLDDQLPLVEADATQLRQVLINLVINASDALGALPGEIRVETGVLRGEPQSAPSAWRRTPLPRGDYAYVRVTDTGCGMDAGTQARMFEPFFTTKFMGRGLGLSAVLGIVRNHQGDIQVKSELGKGTCLQVLLPCMAKVCS